MALPKNVLGYRWLTKDPIVDVFRRAKEISGLTFAEIALKSGVTEGTLRKWDYGTTKRPQHLTMRFALEACGFREVWRRIDGKDGEYLTVSYDKDSAGIAQLRKE